MRILFIHLLAAVAAIVALTGCGDNYTVVDPQESTATGLDATLQLAETHHDFGEVPVGQTVEHKFRISNTGDAELRLEEPDVKLLEGC